MIYQDIVKYFKKTERNLEIEQKYIKAIYELALQMKKQQDKEAKC